MKPSPNTITKTTRHVIADQLLMSLDGGTKVAILATEADLTLLITALRAHAACHGATTDIMDLVAGLEQLKDAAYGTTAKALAELESATFPGGTPAGVKFDPTKTNPSGSII